MLIGAVVGFILGPEASMFKPLGTIFVNLLKMCMVPVIFLSITLSIGEVSDTKKFGRIGMRIFGLFCITTVIASFIGIFWAKVINPGAYFTGDIHAGAVDSTIESLSIIDTIVGFVPTNIFAALSSAQLICIVFFCCIFGAAIAALPADVKEPLIKLLSATNEAINLMINWILKVAPIGVFGLMANSIGLYGNEILGSLSRFLLTEWIAALTQWIVVYGALLAILGKRNIFKFIGQVKSAIFTAFSTTSSTATVPVTLEAAEKVGIPKDVAGFAIPFGATVNQDGAALNLPICILFSATIYGIDIPWSTLLLIVFLALIMSIGGAGIPAGFTVFIIMLLNNFNIPTDVFGIILGCYVLIDCILTATNVLGDLVCTTIICRREGLLREKAEQNK